MSKVELQIVRSTREPDKVSLRPLNRRTSRLREELTGAGFKPGDRIVVVDKVEYEALVAAQRATRIVPSL